MTRWMAIVGLCGMPACVFAAWQTVASEAGKRVEIDRDSIVRNAKGEAMARGRIVLDKPIVDPRTSTSYRSIEISNRFDCDERTYATLKRSYFKENGDLLRQEEVTSPYDMPVRSGSPDDKLFREACRPGERTGNGASAGSAIEKANEAAAGLRQLNEAMIAKEVKKEALRPAGSGRNEGGGHGGKPDAPRKSEKSGNEWANVAWAYNGAGGPENWAKLRPEYRLCGSGRRQSPIDIQDGLAVDLEPIGFAYRPSGFKVIDSGKSLLVPIYGGGFSLLGKTYVLTQMLFHRPAEITVAGKSFAMDVQLLHRADDGKIAIVSVLLESGPENPVIQTVLNNLPLERGGEVAPPSLSIDVERLLPEDRRYYAFMGSLTTPPCTEEVLWLVLKRPQPVSPEQLAIFQRLYAPNARPVQPSLGRIIKESR